MYLRPSLQLWAQYYIPLKLPRFDRREFDEMLKG